MRPFYGRDARSRKARCIFPLHELLSAAVLLALVIAGLYFVTGAWGAALLWGVALLFTLPLAGAVAGLFIEAASRSRKRESLAAAGLFASALVATAGWVGAVAYVGYSAWSAIP